MKLIRRHFRLIAVAVSCVAVGAGVSAIASAGASTSSSSAGSSSKAARHPRLTALRALRRSVHGDLVLATKNGLVTVTFDRGKVQAVNGQQLTIDEGTRVKTDKVVRLTVPTNARVRDNGTLTTLSTVRPGQHVLVVQGPKLWHVIARTPRNP